MFRYCKEGVPPKDIVTSQAFTRFMYRLYKPLGEGLRSGTMTLMNMLNHSSGCVKLESTPGYVCFWDLQTLPPLEDLKFKGMFCDTETGEMIAYSYTINARTDDWWEKPRTWPETNPHVNSLFRTLWKGFDRRIQLWNVNPPGIIQRPSTMVVETDLPDEYFLAVHKYHAMRKGLRKNLRIIRTLIAMKAYTSEPAMDFPWVPHDSRVFRKHVERTTSHFSFRAVVDSLPKPVVSSINEWLD